MGETTLALVGALVLGIAAALALDPLPLGALTAVVAVAVLIVAAGSQRPHTGRVAWLVPPLLRGLEYGVPHPPHRARRPRRDAAVLRAARACSPSITTTPSTGCATSACRRRPGCARRAAAGRGACSLACVLALAGVLGPGLLVAALALGALFVTETVVSWVRFARAERPAALDDEDDEVQDA